MSISNVNLSFCTPRNIFILGSDTGCSVLQVVRVRTTMHTQPDSEATQAMRARVRVCAFGRPATSPGLRPYRRARRARPGLRDRSRRSAHSRAILHRDGAQPLHHVETCPARPRRFNWQVAKVRWELDLKREPARRMAAGPASHRPGHRTVDRLPFILRDVFSRRQSTLEMRALASHGDARRSA